MLCNVPLLGVDGGQLGSGITLVGTPTFTEDGTITLPDGLQENDLVIQFYGESGASSIADGSGYTSLVVQAGTPAAIISYKFMGSVPDTTATVAKNAVDGGAIAIALRGVDSLVPFDGVSPVITEANSGQPDPGSIAPATAGSMVLVMGVIRDPTVFTAPPDYTLIDSQHFHNHVTVALAYRDDVSGVEDPGAFGSTLNDEWLAVAIVLRGA